MIAVRTIAIVDGYSTGRYLAEQLRTMGARCLHVSSQRTMPEPFTRGFDGSPYEEDLGYEADFGRLADELRRRGVSAVAPGTESGVLLADRLAARLGLPGNEPDHRRARRDKYLMARTVAAAGLRVPASDLVHNAEMARGWFESHGFDEVVVKPLDSAGGDQVRFCRTSSESAEAA